jgi:hypothetical protein
LPTGRRPRRPAGKPALASKLFTAGARSTAAKRLRALEQENAKPKRLAAELLRHDQAPGLVAQPRLDIGAVLFNYRPSCNDGPGALELMRTSRITIRAGERPKHTRRISRPYPQNAPIRAYLSNLCEGLAERVRFELSGGGREASAAATAMGTAMAKRSR